MIFWSSISPSPMAQSFFFPKEGIVLTFYFLLIIVSQCRHAASSSSSCCLKSIISFGDSLTDTGNLLHMYQSDPPYFFTVPPYGETFFHRPTGRCSDGRLIIDFIAEYLELPFVPPFYGGDNMISYGCSVNFATASANALPDSFFVARGIHVNNANISLVDQLRWFKELFLPKFYHNPSEREKYLSRSVILMGEIGGNDYNHAFVGGISKEIVATFVPQVVKLIASTIREVIKLGGVTIMVPGNLPIGCSALYLTLFKSSNEKDEYYDPHTGCINWLNNFSQHHNNLLRSQLDLIRNQNPHTNIIYVDYYNAAMLFYRSPHKYGFAKGALTACCPRCGPYEVDPASSSSSSGACEDPSEYVSWDGMHLTEAAYRVLATALFTSPKLNLSASASPSPCPAPALSLSLSLSDH